MFSSIMIILHKNQPNNERTLTDAPQPYGKQKQGQHNTGGRGEGNRRVWGSPQCHGCHNHGVDLASGCIPRYLFVFALSRLQCQALLIHVMHITGRL